MPGARERRRLGTALLVAGSVIGTLGLAEIALRISRPTLDGYYVHPPGLHRQFLPAPGALVGVRGAVSFRVNRDGLRGDERRPADAYRILALGGSTTECLYLDHEETWPARLQHRLDDEFGPAHRTWVGNAGRSGRRSRDHVTQLEALLSQIDGIDAAILLLGANDVMRRLAEDEGYDPISWREPEARAAHLAHAFAVTPEGGGSGSALLALLRRAGTEARARARRVQLQDEQGASYERWRAWRAAATEIRETPPDLGPALDEYLSNVDRLAQIARAAGVRIVFLSQPSLYREDLPRELERLLWMGGVGDFNRGPGSAYYSVAAMAEIFRRYNDALRERCASGGLECVDLARAVPRSTDAFYDDVHFNEAGADRVARVLFDYLRSRPPFDGWGREGD